MTREELLRLIDQAADEGWTELDLAGLGLEELPDAIGKCTQLETLVLVKWDEEKEEWVGNQLTEFPDAVLQLTNLKILSLACNQIREIPAAIASLSNLTELDLRYNQIREIPAAIASLSNLTELDLRYNQIREIPAAIASLSNLTELDLRYNQIREIPAAIASLSNLTGLDLSNNQITEIPAAIASLSNLTKLELSDNQITEIPAAIASLSNLTKLNLWNNQIREIPAAIASLSNLTGLDLSGNQIREIPAAIASLSNLTELKLWSNQITEIPAAIASLSNLTVYDLLPLTWFNVKQSLENLDKDFITISEYATLCATENILKETDQTQLIGLLHNLGIVLNFREHPILQSTNILNPHWVTEGIYALLSDDDLKTKTKGILTHADLSRILDSQRYPSHRYNCLTELMGEFQLCFPLPDSKQKFLIPGILPKEEPQNTQLEGDTLEFQYHYRILPDSILSRFIVLTHEKIHNATYWRTGVMLEYREGTEVYNIARIKSDPEDKKIFIAISGRESTRRSFLSLIRDTFNKIHNSFANLEVGQWVPVPGHPDADPLDYEELLGLEEMGENTKLVGKLKLRLDLRQLLDGYEAIEVRRKRQMGDKFSEKEYDDLVEITKLAVSRPIINKAEAQVMTQDSSKTNNFNGPMYGIIGSDNAQINSFIQNNHANTAELLQLITSMRQTAAQFPPDVRDEIIIDIEDVEAEIQKPESDRNKTRLKKRLAAILAAATATGVAIAGMTDFANNAIDLSNKLGIEVSLPSPR